MPAVHSYIVEEVRRTTVAWCVNPSDALAEAKKQFDTQDHRVEIVEVRVTRKDRDVSS